MISQFHTSLLYLLGRKLGMDKRDAEEADVLDLARRRLRDIDQFAGVDRDRALRDFQGDPLSFDRLYESSQKTLDAANRTALGIERLVDRINRPQPVIVLNQNPGGG